MERVQKGKAENSRDLGFPFWTSRRSRFHEHGLSAVLIKRPFNRAYDEGWTENGFWGHVVLHGLMEMGERVCKGIQGSRPVGDREVDLHDEWLLRIGMNQGGSSAKGFSQLVKASSGLRRSGQGLGFIAEHRGEWCCYYAEGSDKTVI